MKTPEHPIFLKSIEFIRSQIDVNGLNGIDQSILERIIHASGDLTLPAFLKFSSGASDLGVNALKMGTKILTDTYMAVAAISPMAERTLQTDVQCILDKAPQAVDSLLITRSAIGMRNMWLDLEKKDDLKVAPIVVIGSAPTALMALLDLIEQGSRKPSLIIGMPVGFIGVSESKTRLLNSHCPFIVLNGSKGGASVASATVNALLKAAEN